MPATHRRPACVLLLAALLLGPVRAQAQTPGGYDFGAGGTLVTSSALLLGAAEKQTLGRIFDTSTCGWCGKNGFDGWFIGDDYRLRPRARRVSDATLLLSLGSALVASHSGFSRDGRERLGAVGTSIGAAVIALQITKNVARRRRPYAQVEPSGRNDDNKSFFSGHTAATVAASVAALEVRKHEGLRTRRPWAVLAVTTAGTTAVLRVAARKHYVTDIVAGAAVGWGAARLMTKWLERPPQERPAQSRLAPVVVPLVSRATPGGAQLALGPLSVGERSGVGLSLSWR